MKTTLKFSTGILGVLLLISCTEDVHMERLEPVEPVFSGGNPGEDNGHKKNVYFGFLDGGGSSDEYIDMPIENSSINLLIGRWQIIKLGIDENNDGKIDFYNYSDYEHKECGQSFLQFNSDVVFENNYYNDEGTCTLYVEIDNWELIEPDRLKIYVYDIIYIIDVTSTELILKYDWRFENSLYGPMQVYYYYERITQPASA
jgi:hypothetical protein